MAVTPRPHITQAEGHHDRKGENGMGHRLARLQRPNHRLALTNNLPQWAEVFAVGVAVRLIQAFLGLVLYRLLSHAYPKIPHGFHPRLLWTPGLSIWSNWDGLWYLSIAHLGYQGRIMATAFFPTYPILLAWVGGTVLGGVLLSWAAFVIGLIFLWQWTQELYGTRAAWYTVAACSSLPTAFYYGAVYTESLFFALATASLYYMGHRSYGVAATLSGLASAVSIYGALLSLSLATAIWRHPNDRRSLRRWLPLLWAAWGMVLYMGFLLLRFGHPMMFARVQYIWGRHRTWPWITMNRALHMAWRTRFAFHNPRWLLPVSHPAYATINAWNLIFFVFAVTILARWGTRLPKEWWLYAITALILPLLDPSRTQPLMSFPRLLLAVIPVFPVLGMVLERSRVARWIYLLLAIPLGLWMMSRFVTFRWVA